MFQLPSRKPPSPWVLYARGIANELEKAGYQDRHVQALLAYAKPLFDAQLPVIYEPAHFSALVGYEHEFVCAAAFAAKGFYREFEIKKKCGGYRSIVEPLPSLKEVQRWVLAEILYRIPPSRFAKAYIPGVSLVQNARFHRRQEVVVRLDFENFFGSVSERSVQGVFSSAGYSNSVSRFLAAVCCFEHALPQGAPTSPALSNLCCRRLDARIGGWALAKGYRYTRYADDMTFSGPSLSVRRVVRFVSMVARECGYTLNHKKTRVMRRSGAQVVTGVVTNEGANPPRKVRRSFRQQVYYIRQYGVDAHLVRVGEQRRNYLSHLLGIGTYMRQLRPRDQELQRDCEFLKGLVHEVHGAE